MDAREGDLRYGDAMRRSIFQLSFAGEHASEHGHDVLPWMCRADGNVVPRIRARLGVLATQNAPEDTPIEVYEVIQAYLRRDHDHQYCPRCDERARKDPYRVEHVGAIPDVGGLFETKCELRVEMEEERRARGRPCPGTDDRGRANDV